MMGMGRVRVKTPKIAAIPPISFPVKIQCWVHFLLTHTYFLGIFLEPVVRIVTISK